MEYGCDYSRIVELELLWLSVYLSMLSANDLMQRAAL